MLVNLPFAMGHKIRNLGSKRLILDRDIRSRIWPNIGDSYGTIGYYQNPMHIFFLSSTSNHHCKQPVQFGPEGPQLEQAT